MKEFVLLSYLQEKVFVGVSVCENSNDLSSLTFIRLRESILPIPSKNHEISELTARMSDKAISPSSLLPLAPLCHAYLIMSVSEVFVHVRFGADFIL